MLAIRIGYAITGIPSINRGMMQNFRRFMIQPFQKALKEADRRSVADSKRALQKPEQTKAAV
jgi:hypothetical protein